ncbi:cell division protein FtsZ [Aphanomyces invadans]|uniref:Cell division protein FtsZ n=1 Tax=Aphanomyces invadans TaxID=157072 RepID=A0A024UMA5_9STRA|nr:cell division protein FtsZ [Aphanomyces invadans]ETW07315.1 cell division protein FtsZ [Aphanomyces invadans]|eukprot:XP_008863408.1 cell division protein FtsZ [Aphanomyces invadans]
MLRTFLRRGGRGARPYATSSLASKVNGSDVPPFHRSSPSSANFPKRPAGYQSSRSMNDSNHRTGHQPKSHKLKNGRPVITVIGVGGAGSNAVNSMITSQLEGVDFVVANTDCQALVRSLTPRKITLGKELTKGLGAGSKPSLGKSAAEMSRDDIVAQLEGSNMLFVTGGMGGGTCTGAAPVIANIAREMGILTVAVVSTPFRSEGPNRTRLALQGLAALSQAVDTLIVVPNQNLLALSDPSTTLVDAFRYADAVLLEGVKGVTDLIVKPGLINLDFADINTILSKAGRAMMGSGQACGANRAEEAAHAAMSTPLLGDLPTEHATGLLVTIRGGEDMTLYEVDAIMGVIREKVAESANVIFGTCYDPSIEGSIHVSVIVSGIKMDQFTPPAGKVRVPPTEIAAGSGGATSTNASNEPSNRGLFGFFKL